MWAAVELRADREIVLAAVKQNGLALDYAAVALQANREIVLVAVKQNGLALEYAAVELRADHGIVLAAVLENEESLQHASEEIRKRNRLITLFAERHPGEIRVRCFGLSADEIVVHFELDAAAEVLVPRVKDALPRGLGRITLVLPGGTILQPQPGMGPLDLQLLDGTMIEGSTFGPLSVQELFEFFQA